MHWKKHEYSNQDKDNNLNTLNKKKIIKVHFKDLVNNIYTYIYILNFTLLFYVVKKRNGKKNTYKWMREFFIINIIFINVNINRKNTASTKS